MEERTTNSLAFFNTGETASSYLLHFEHLLQRVVTQGALSPGEAKHVRLCQVQIGARYSLTLIRDLNQLGQKSNPPGFSLLVQEVRDEEILHLRDTISPPPHLPIGDLLARS